jgi:putative phosphoesterase
MRIGLISDTHLPSSIREPWAEVAAAFHGVNLILHAGDIVTSRILDWLEDIAPVLAAMGNNDFGMDDPRVKTVHTLDVEGWRLGLVHDVTSGVWFDSPVDIVVSGHTHYERLTHEDGVVHINSGSATLPHHHSTRLGTVGILNVERDLLSASIIRLGDGPLKGGTLLPNPGLELHLEVSRGGLHSRGSPRP